MSTYKVAQLEEIEEITDGRCPWRPVRKHFGIMSFGINAWTAPNAGDRIINEHDEDGEHEELYIVQRGRATFELDGERIDAPEGTFVFADPGVKRTAFAEEPGTTVIALGGTPGQAFEPNGWEVWAPIHALYLDGRYDEAADRGAGLIEANPEYADVAYNVACWESLAGRTADAIDHLRLAIERSERFREFAAGDTDLDPIREEPAFKELMVQPQAS
jgi:tetratricopeptide (TPR) repeat protein